MLFISLSALKPTIAKSKYPAHVKGLSKILLFGALAMPFVCSAELSPALSTKSQATSPGECVFQWNVQARGFSLGITQDTVRWSKASASVISRFTPNAIASALGAPVLERKWTSSAKQGISREEAKYKGTDEPDKVRWTVTGDKLWKNVNRGEPQEFPAPAGANAGLVKPGAPGVRYIDSTVFAYLELVGQPLADGPALAWVLNRQEPYQANTKKTADTVEYNAGNKHGIVSISNGKPTKLSFSEGSEKFEATVVSADCK